MSNRVSRLQYGSFPFPDNFTHSLVCRPWYAADEITSKGVECTLTVEFYLYNNSYRGPANDAFTNSVSNNLDRMINVARQELLTPRKNLIIKGTGWAFNEAPNVEDNVFPDVILGSQGGALDPTISTLPRATIYADINNGPIPQELTVDPLVGASAVKCTWKCTFWFTFCKRSIDPALSDKIDFLTELLYETNYTINADGRMRYSIVGTYTLRNVNLTALQATYIDRQSLGEPIFTPNAQKDLLLLEPIVPPGFRLTERTHRLGNTNNRIDFRFELEELEGNHAYYPYVTKMDFKHQASSDVFSNNAVNGSGLVTWVNRLDGTVSLVPGRSAEYAWEVFLTTLMQRALIRQQSTRGDPLSVKNYPFPGKPIPSVSKKAESVIVKKLTVTEGIYTNTHTFSCEWLVTCGLNDLLNRTGLFSSVIPVREGWLIGNRTSQNILDARNNAPLKNKVYYQTETGNKSSNSLSRPSRDVKKIFFDPCPSQQNGVDSFDDEIIEVAARQADRSVNGQMVSDLFSFTPLATGDVLIQSTEETFTVNPAATYVSYVVEFSVEENSRAYQVPINSGDALNQIDLLSRKRHTVAQAPFSVTPGSQNALQFEKDPGSMVPRYTTMAEGTSNESVFGNQAPQPSCVIVAGGENTYKVVMTGSAIRAFFPVTCPAVVAVEGFVAIRAPGYTFTQTRVNNSRVPLYRASWNVEYYVTGQLFNPHADLTSNPTQFTTSNTYTNANMVKPGGLYG
jgi:hypothetical protein